MFIDTTIEAASTANLSVAPLPLAARLAGSTGSLWAPASGPGRIELLATVTVLGLALLLVTGTLAETLAS